MQILLGSFETIIKINSSSIGMEYIQHYISTHFKDIKIENNSIYIPASKLLHNHRQFLLKWIYTLYEKRTKNNIPELKEMLIKRYAKAIKIQLKEDISYKISYKLIDQERVQISIVPKHHKIAHLLKTFLQVEMQIYPNYIEMCFSDETQKRRLEKFIQEKKLIQLPYQHIYDKEKMAQFFSKNISTKKLLSSPLLNAYTLLGVSEQTDSTTLKRSYKSLAKRYHPDRAQSDNIDSITEYTKKFQNILAAYELVTEHLKRSNYQEAS